MILYLAGAEHIIQEAVTLPVNVTGSDTCSNSNPFWKNGYNIGEMNERVRLYQESIENIVHKDLFSIHIERVMPEMGLLSNDNLAVAGFLSMFAQSVDINRSYLGTDTLEGGSFSLKSLKKRESGNLTISFLNPIYDVATSFFLKDKDGNDIAPKDGTTLLPLEYYFKIQVWQWQITEGIRVKTMYIDNFYHIDSNLNFNFGVEEQDTFQTFDVEFVKMEVGLDMENSTLSDVLSILSI